MQETCSSVPQKDVMEEENIFVDIKVSELFKICWDKELGKIQALERKNCLAWLGLKWHRFSFSFVS